jgi:hypothetical protein
MRKISLMILIVFSIAAHGLGRNEGTLRKELEILKPFVGKTWLSETKDPSGRMTLHFLLRWESMHDGKILRHYGECSELKIQTDGYFYYDSDKKEIAYLWLTSNGNITVGNVKGEAGKLLLYGFVIFPDRKLEFRNTFEMTPVGKIVDQYFRFEDGEWKAGHSRVYTAK